MKNFARCFAIATIISSTGVAAQPPPARFAAPPPPARSAEFHTPGPMAFPNFCDIPPTPKNVLSAQAYKTEVVETRLAGLQLENQTAPGTWSLTGTEDFQSGAIREAAPPPPMTPPGGADTKAFVAKSKAKATPPHKPH